MQVQAYLNFAGRCEEALEFYKKSIGAEVNGLMRWKESPDKEMKGQPGYEEKNIACRLQDRRNHLDGRRWHGGAGESRVQRRHADTERRQ